MVLLTSFRYVTLDITCRKTNPGNEVIRHPLKTYVVEERNALGTTESVAGAHRARFRDHVSKLGMSCLFACACDLHFAVTIAHALI